MATVADVYGVEQAQVVRDTFCQLRIRSTREHDLATVVAARLESRDEGPAIGKNRRIELAGQRDALLHSCLAAEHPKRQGERHPGALSKEQRDALRKEVRGYECAVERHTNWPRHRGRFA